MGNQTVKLGFVSAILPELSLEEVFAVAQKAGYDCVEVMCWPVTKAERRYAGITHIDVNSLTDAKVTEIKHLVERTGISISGLGYYPNPLSANEAEASAAVAQLKQVIIAAKRLGVGVVNTFVGRNPVQSVDENWPRFLETWKPLVALAESNSVRIGIENCPMLFTRDEWPGGKNLASNPAVWRRMFEAIPSLAWGLNYDPSHMVWQNMNYLKPLGEFADRLVHLHAKDVRVDQHLLDEVGTLAYPNLYHSPKLPGMGTVDWGRFFSVLTDAGYRGPICVEVEDRAYEGSLAGREAALVQSARYLRQFVWPEARAE
jgi:sugar phosphate isomerase/epimerase